MAASPHVLVQDGAGPFINPDSTGDLNFPAGVNATPGNTVSIKLTSTDSVSQWNLKIFGIDELTPLPTLTGVDPQGNVSTPATVVTFVLPPGAAGRTYLFQSVVNNGGPVYTTRFGVYTLTVDGFRVAAVGERFEGDSTFGWARTVNRFIRNGIGSGGPPSGIASGDLGGVYPNPDVVNLHGTSVPASPAAGEILEATSPTAAHWLSLAPQTVVVGSVSGNVKRQLTEDDILPGFAIASFVPGGTNYAAVVELGTQITSVGATATYTSGPPTAGSITNSTGGSSGGGDVSPGSWTFNSPFASGSMAGSIKRTGIAAALLGPYIFL